MTRFSALLAPVLLCVYGVLRLVDGRDGDHGPGWAWNVGHAFFFVAFVLFAVLTVRLRAAVVAIGAPGGLGVANAAAAVALVGVACFLWVIAGDLFSAVPDLPDPVLLIGPIAFQLGVLALLGQLVAARRLPLWSPVVVLAGFLMFAFNLDLLPVGALVILAGCLPVARGAVDQPRRRITTPRTDAAST